MPPTAVDADPVTLRWNTYGAVDADPVTLVWHRLRAAPYLTVADRAMLALIGGGSMAGFNVGAELGRVGAGVGFITGGIAPVVLRNRTSVRRVLVWLARNAQRL